MNREIKFRAWDKYNKRMINRIEEDGEYAICFNGEIRCIKHGETPFNITLPQGLELQQYTGLTDKNGKEIYFEDFVEDENGDIFIVKWNKTKIDLINISNCAIIDMKDNLIIKSNIYENEFKFSSNHTEIP